MQSSTRLLPGYLQLQISEIGWAHCTPPRPSCSRYPCQPNSLDETHVLDVDKHSVTVFVALASFHTSINQAIHGRIKVIPIYSCCLEVTHSF